MRRILWLLPAFVLATSGGAEQTRHYYTRSTLPEDGTMTIDTAAHSCIVESRVSLLENVPRRGMSRDWWGMRWNEDSTEWLLKLQCGNTDYGDILDERFVRVTLSKDNMPLLDCTLKKNLDGYGGYNILSAEWNGDTLLRVSAGNGEPIPLGTVRWDTPIPREIWIVGEGRRDLDMAVVETDVKSGDDLETGWTADGIVRYLSSSTDPVEGYWRYLDRDMDEECLRLGGDYRLAAVREGEGYLLLYVDGARVNDVAWHPGMMKGRLVPTPFVNNYDLVWYDSLRDGMGPECHASVNGSVMTLEFPLYNKGRIRLYKE